MFVALIVFLSMSILGSLISMLASVASRDYSDGTKFLVVFTKILWMAFAIILLVGLCSK